MVFKTVGWIIILHGQEMSQRTLVRNVPKYMRILTKLESGMTRDALCLPQTRVKPQLSSVKKDSCDGEASIWSSSGKRAEEDTSLRYSLI